MGKLKHCNLQISIARTYATKESSSSASFEIYVTLVGFGSDGQAKRIFLGGSRAFGTKSAREIAHKMGKDLSSEYKCPYEVHYE